MKPARLAGLGLALVVLAAFPLVFTNGLVTTLGFYCVTFAAAASGWNLFSGFSGYFSLGHAVFFGIGAYTIALLALHLHMTGSYSIFALVPLGGLAAGVIALPLGWVVLRVRRHAFVVITIAMFFIFQYLAENLGFTLGSQGVLLPIPTFPVATFNIPFYYSGAILLVLTVACVWSIRRSRMGLQLYAIRDDEDRARSLGVRVARVKITAFCLSALFVGMAGALWAYFLGQIFPQFAFNPSFDLTMALMSFLGGLGTVSGPIVGGIVLEAVERYLVLTVPDQNLYLIVYGVLFLMVVLFAPQGVLHPAGRGVAKVWGWIGRGGWRAQAAAPPASEPAAVRLGTEPAAGDDSSVRPG